MWLSQLALSAEYVALVVEVAGVGEGCEDGGVCECTMVCQGVSIFEAGNKPT